MNCDWGPHFVRWTVLACLWAVVGGFSRVGVLDTRRSTNSVLAGKSISAQDLSHGYSEVHKRGVVNYSERWFDKVVNGSSALSSPFSAHSNFLSRIVQRDIERFRAINSSSSDETSLPLNAQWDDNAMRSYLDDTTDGHNPFQFRQPTRWQQLRSQFREWTLRPWKFPSRESVAVHIKLGGSMPLESGSSNQLLGSWSTSPVLSSLQEAVDFLHIAACDPLVSVVQLSISSLSCGYGKLAELTRAIAFYRQSGKQVIAYLDGGGAKEFFLAVHCTRVYAPPTAHFDLSGFAASAQFFRNLLNKIGVEPQFQRIGEYKSFGDSILRNNMSDAQREVTSSMLGEASMHWLQRVTAQRNLSIEDTLTLWGEEPAHMDAQSLASRGLLTGVMYLDQLESQLKQEFGYLARGSLLKYWWQRAAWTLAHPHTPLHSNNSSALNASVHSTFNLTGSFLESPRRTLRSAQSTTSTALPVPNHGLAITATLWLSKVKTALGISKSVPTETNSDTQRAKQQQLLDEAANIECEMRSNRVLRVIPGHSYLHRFRGVAPQHVLPTFPYRETTTGARIAVINAVGSIAEGSSRQGSASGRVMGAESLAELLKVARLDPSIKAVVLRIDSPGGSALASDLLWRELRCLSECKPVVASMVDVAASGGYYLAMGCDQIVAEELTLTGSIGVVLGKWNFEELAKKIGVHIETLSIGKFAELFTSNAKAFTADEQRAFEHLAQQAYESFVTKAAASRNMTVEAMHAHCAQGRVWTGRQAKALGLVDALGGLFKSVELAAWLFLQDAREFHGPDSKDYRRFLKAHQDWFLSPKIQYLRPNPPTLFELLTGSASMEAHTSSMAIPSLSPPSANQVLAMASNDLFASGLVSASSTGLSPLLTSLGVPADLSALLMTSGLWNTVDRFVQGTSKGIGSHFWGDWMDHFNRVVDEITSH